MPRTIKIETYKGLLTNGNRNNIPPEYCLQLSNFRAYNGKLISVPTPFGLKTSALPARATSLATFKNNHLGTDDWLYIAVIVNSTKKAVTFYGYYPSSDTWVSLGSHFTSFNFYHKYDENPVIQDNQIIRFLPGNVGCAIGTTEAQGLWFGYIDKKYFDELWIPTADFYGYPCPLETPAQSYTMTDLAGGSFTAVTVRYKFSNIYDGIQESLMSGEIPHVISVTDKHIKIEFSETAANHNKRITALRVYRKDTVNDVFKDIQDIEYDRPSADRWRNTDAASGKDGQYYLYIPSVSYSFNTLYSYKFQINGADNFIVNPGTGTGFDSFIIFGGGSVSGNYFSATQAWSLFEDSGSGYGAPVATGTGVYCGQDVFLANISFSTGALMGYLL